MASSSGALSREALTRINKFSACCFISPLSYSLNERNNEWRSQSNLPCLIDILQYCSCAWPYRIDIRGVVFCGLNHLTGYEHVWPYQSVLGSMKDNKYWSEPVFNRIIKTATLQHVHGAGYLEASQISDELRPKAESCRFDWQGPRDLLRTK